MRFIHTILMNIAFRIMKKYFDVVSVYHKNKQVKALHFAVSPEDLKQSIIERYFHILNEDNNDKGITG